MKYIKWQDELESYLYSLPREEKDKVFSYFSEMYADKREAGLSEEEIVESFGPPYDVAKRILSENGQVGDGFFDAPPVRPEREDRHRNREYIRRNGEYDRPEREAPPVEKKRGWGHMIGGVILALILFSLSATLIGIPIGLLVDGFADVGAAIGAMAAGSFTGAAGAATIGGGMMLIGGAFIALAPVSYIVTAIWKKFKAWF